LYVTVSKNPIYLGIEVSDGFKFQPLVTVITIILRNYSFRQKKLKIVEHQSLYELLSKEACLHNFENLLDSMIEIFNSGDHIQKLVLNCLDYYTANVDAVKPFFWGPEMNLVLKHMACKLDLERLHKNFRSDLVAHMNSIKYTNNSKDFFQVKLG